MNIYLKIIFSLLPYIFVFFPFHLKVSSIICPSQRNSKSVDFHYSIFNLFFFISWISFVIYIWQF